MNALELQRYLHEHIPLSMAMQVAVMAVQPDGVILEAPLPPNINHRDTVFGGSASAIAILAAWSLLHTRLIAAGIVSRLVIQRNTMEYDAPILGAFTARSFIESAASWERFARTLARKGKARITVCCELQHAGRPVGRLVGEFVALAPMRDYRTLIAKAYAAFNQRDVEGALALMTSDVRWPKASEGGSIVGKDEIRAYWLRQWSEFDPHVVPLEMTEDNGRIRVQVRQMVRTLKGELLADAEVVHVFTLERDRIAAMTLAGDEAEGPSAAFAKPSGH